jgi:hypothetical protein
MANVIRAEIILADGSSEDGTLQMLEVIADQNPDEWIKVVEVEKTAGPAVQRTLEVLSVHHPSS